MSLDAQMKTIATVIGTRPEAVKLAPVVLKLAEARGVRSHVCVSGQHGEILDPILEAFRIGVDTRLDVLRPGQGLAALGARMIEALDEFYQKVRPDLVLVQGDTATVLSASLAAFYNRIPVGHVEAGLRTGDLEAPWPEEAHRVLTARLAALHFAPTEAARENLRREGVPDEAIHVTGNTGIDALLIVRDALHRGSIAGGSVIGHGDRRPLVLITAHRRENFGEPLASICQAIADLAGAFPDVRFVYPVHPNPNVREPVHRILGDANDPRLTAGNLRLVEPLAYPEFVGLMDRSLLILTDSGGIQEEAPSLGKPVLVLRETTERPEAVAAGTARIVGTNRATIVREASKLLNEPNARDRMSRALNPFGDGQAAGRIVEHCRDFLGVGR